MRSSRRVVAAGIGCLALCGTLSACKSPVNRPGGTYSAYKPRADAQPRRALFLGGYAGYNYGPIANRNQIPTNEGGDLYGTPISRKAAKTHDEIW